MLRQLSRLVRSAFNYRPVSSGCRRPTLRSGGPGYFKRLRVEPLERRDLLTGYVTVSATTSSVSEGGSASFGIFCMNAPAAGVTVHYQTTPGSATAGLDYTPISGSVFLTPGTPHVTINVSTTADAVNDPGESFSFTLTSVVGDAFLGSSSAGVTINQPSGPPQGPPPGWLTLDPVGTLNEGQVFYLTGRITPPAAYSVAAAINWGGSFAMMGGGGASFTTGSDGSFSIANIYYDDGVSPGNGTASDVVNISMTATVTGVQLTANSTATIHNVAPTADTNHLEYTPIGGPHWQVSGTIQDLGIADVHTVTIDWGDDTAPTILTNVT